jgi:hypothetical protein
MKSKEYMDMVPQILNFGFLGLSLLMVFLGYGLTKKVVEKGENKPELISITKYFLKISMIFMLLAGPLQWITLWITSYTEKKSVVLLISAVNPTWKEEFGKVYLDKGKNPKIISSEKIEETFSDKEEVRIDLAEVVNAIRNLQQQLFGFAYSQSTPELKETQKGGH